MNDVVTIETSLRCTHEKASSRRCNLIAGDSRVYCSRNIGSGSVMVRETAQVDHRIFGLAAAGGKTETRDPECHNNSTQAEQV